MYALPQSKKKNKNQKPKKKQNKKVEN